MTNGIENIGACWTILWTMFMLVMKLIQRGFSRHDEYSVSIQGSFGESRLVASVEVWESLSLSDPAGLNWAFEDCMYYAALTTEGLAKGNNKINRLRVTSERTLGDQSEEVSFVRGKGKYL